MTEETGEGMYAKIDAGEAVDGVEGGGLEYFGSFTQLGCSELESLGSENANVPRHTSNGTLGTGGILSHPSTAGNWPK
jgi:hypothetical protein